MTGMTNREKYKFDYFTLDHYKEIIALAKQMGFTFISYEQEFDENRKDVLWRHDVEFSPDVALKMAQIESDQGVQATYFFQLHSHYYNTLAKHYTDVFNKIKDLGHHIGLHFDAHYYDIQTQAELDKYIQLDKKYFEDVMYFHIKVFSFHNTNPFILSCEDFKYGGLINVYSSYFKTHYNYCADSTGYWRYEILDEVILDEKVQHLQVLTHDAMWTDGEILSPRKRVRKSVQDSADRVKAMYDDFFLHSPAKNIDD